MNGAFSNPIAIQRGVHQGYPVAPFLFVLFTQPLLAYLHHQCNIGALSGLPITPTLSLGEQLFADDIGIFLPVDYHSFQAFQQCITTYEHASSAKPNLAKSTIIPIGVSPIPNWLKATSCILAKPGDITRYLGAPIGVRLPKSKIQEYCLDRVGKRISSWKAKHLSFMG